MLKILMNFKNFIKEHLVIIILAFSLTALIFAPLLAFPPAAGKEYQGININWFGTDAHFYLTRGKEALAGHGLGSPVLREGKNNADMYLSYSDYILTAPVKLLGLADKVNIVTLYNIYNFIGVFFLILLIYFFVLQLSGNKLLAAAAALFAVGGYSIIYRKTLFYDDFNIYARVIYPYVSSIVLFSYLNLLLKSLRSEGLKYKISAGIIFGSMFYVYFYTWSFVLALNAILFLIFIFKKEFSSVKKILLISTIGLALGSFNLIRLFLRFISHDEIDKQIAYHIWMQYGHRFIFSKIGFLTMAIFAAFFYKRRSDRNLPLILAIILAGWVALNQQIISGVILGYAHYYFYFIVPLSVVVSFYMVWQLIKSEKLKKYLFMLIIAIVFINTAGGQYKSFWSTLGIKKYEQNFRTVIDVLNRDQKPGVIFANQANQYLFTIYTPHDLFWQPIASLSRIPIERFKDALFVYTYFNKEARNNFNGYLNEVANVKEVKGSYYRLLFRNLEGFWSGFDFYTYMDKIAKGDEELIRKRPAVISRLSEEYSEKLLNDNKGINKLLREYGVNYIVWDKNLDPKWDLSPIQGLEQIANYNNIYLYKIN